MQAYLNNSGAVRRSMAASFSEAKKAGTTIDKTNLTAPKSISSKQISSLKTYFYHRDRFDEKRNGKFRFLLADGADGELTLSERLTYRVQAAVSEEILEKVQKIIDKHRLVNLNGIEKYTTGQDEEHSPTYLMVEYESGEELFFYIDGDPDCNWTGELLELFQGFLAIAGFKEVMSSTDAITLDRFELSFNEGNIVREYFPVMKLDETGSKIVQHLRKNIYDTDKDIIISEESIEIPNGYYLRLQELINELNLLEHHNGISKSGRFKYGDNDFFSYCIGMKNLRQYNAFYVGEEIPEECIAVRAELVNFIDNLYI
jgi:hypothetical protein